MTRMVGLLVAGTMVFAATACWADGPAEVAPAVATGTSVIVEGGEPAHDDSSTVVETVDAEGGKTGWRSHLMSPGEQARHLADRFTPSGDCARKLWDWMTYRPQSCRRGCSTCTRTCAPTCVPPLYTYFMWYGGSNCGGACGGACAASCGVATVEEHQDVP